MISKFITAGSRIELQPVDRKIVDGVEVQKMYYSAVHDILSEDTMEITMPMEQTKLILLPIDSEYDMVFYGASGLYQCYARIIDRYKSNNVYILVIELTSSLRKYQRREYYRFSCALEMRTRALTEEEVRAIEKKNAYEFQEDVPLSRAVIVDISGGGLRFVGTQRFETESLIYCNFYLNVKGERKQYELIGKVLAVKELENKQGAFEHRIQYYHISVEKREEIIRFIFDEERKERKKERLS